jgi:hypothetical protein
VSTKFIQIKALGFKLAPLWGAYIQVSDFRAIMALLFVFDYFFNSKFYSKLYANLMMVRDDLVPAYHRKTYVHILIRVRISEVKRKKM